MHRKADCQTGSTDCGDDRGGLDPECVQHEKNRKGEHDIARHRAKEVKQRRVEAGVAVAQPHDAPFDPACDDEPGHEDHDSRENIAHQLCQKLKRDEV